MRRIVRMVGLLALGAMFAGAGCTTTRPPEEYPGLVKAGTPREELCLVREADHCFIGSVGDKYVTQYDINAIAPGTYRQFLMPPGKHVLVLFYRQQRNLETIVSVPRMMTIEIKPGEEYELRSGVHGADAPFGDTLPAANWRPSLIRASDGKQVALAAASNP